MRETINRIEIYNDDGSTDRYCQESEVRELEADHKLAIEALESLKELSGYYYKRGVPHQSRIDHCVCRECTDKRVEKALIILSKLKEPK